MSSLIQIDLPADLQKAKTKAEQFAGYGLSSAAGDAALQAIQDTSEKTKAVIDGIIASVEDDIQNIAINGAQELYDSLGLNEQNIEFARNIVSMAMNASNLAGSAVLNGMQMVNSVDMHALPMSAASAAMGIAQTFADQFVKKLIDKYGIWAELAIQAIVDPGSLLEDIANQILEQIYKIEDLIDDQLQRYIGMSLPTVRRYCNEGLRLYSQYKQARKKLHRKSADDGEEESNRDPVISKKGARHSVDVDIDVDPKILKLELENWLRKQGDGIYNAFLALQIMDAVKTLKDVVNSMTDVSLVTLADSINSLDDLVIMLDDLGLGDDSTAIDLSLVPSLGINDMIASLRSIQENFDAGRAAMELGAAFANSSNINASLNTQKTYVLQSDPDALTISIIFYDSATKYSKQVYKALKKAVDSNNKRLFTEAELKVLTDNISELQDTGGTRSFKLGKYTFDITIKMSSGDDSDFGHDTATEQEKREMREEEELRQRAMEPELAQRESIRREKADKETRRNTIALLHTAFSIIKNLLGPLKIMAQLISNYKINKAYVQEKHHDNLITCFMDAMSRLGLINTAKTDGKTPYSARLYPVRSLRLYNYVSVELRIKMESPTTSEVLTSSEVGSVNKFISDFNRQATLLETEGYTRLYIDSDALDRERRCREKLKEEFDEIFGTDDIQLLSEQADACQETDGTFYGIDNLEDCGDYIVYSDSKLPRLPSQIDTALRNGYGKRRK